MIGSRFSLGEIKKIVFSDFYLFREYRDGHFNTIIDIGANIGVFSVFARMRHPGAKIIAVEPNPEALKFFYDNTNGLNITLVNKAIGNGAKFYFHSRGDTIRDMYLEEESTGNSIESVTILDIKNSYGIEEPYAIKCDCEGAEKHFIGNSDSERILLGADFIALEIHFKSQKNNVGGWIEWEDYRNWINSVFVDTHSILYYKSSRRRGFGHYVLKRNITNQ